MLRSLKLVGLGILLGLIFTAFYSRLLGPVDVGSEALDSVLSRPAQARAVRLDSLNISRRNGITHAVQLVKDAVVGINVTQVHRYVQQSPFSRDPFFRQFFPDRVIERQVNDLGSGFIISSDGYIVTNEHVVHNASEIVVTLPNTKSYNAVIVGSDFDSDIALLKIDEEEELPYIHLGTSQDLLIGEWVIALGNPYGLFAINDKPAVTVGVVSATGRDFGRQQNQRIYKDMIQTDAAINPGNSGGPLVNVFGEVVGMNTMIYSESGGSVGLGFAIPVDRIMDVVRDLRKYGSINRNVWTGIYVQDLDRYIARALGYDSTDGAVIKDLDPGSPGAEAGLKVYDIIVAINNHPVTNHREIEKLLYNSDLRVGGVLHFRVFRDGKYLDVDVTLKERR